MSQEEMNSLTLEDVCYQIHPTVKFYRHKSNGMLTADIRLEAEADDADPFTMSIQKMPTDLTTVKALEGKASPLISTAIWQDLSFTRMSIIMLMMKTKLNF